MGSVGGAVGIVGAEAIELVVVAGAAEEADPVGGGVEGRGVVAMDCGSGCGSSGVG